MGILQDAKKLLEAISPAETSVVLPDFVAEIDRYANILIRPNQAKS